MASFSLSDLDPGVLKWARETSGLNLTEAAEKIGVTEEVLAQWEAETAEISYSKIRKMAEHYHVTTAILFLPKPPQHVKRVVDRRRTQELDSRYIREEKMAIKRAYDKRLIFVETAGSLKTTFPVFEMDVAKIPAYAAEIRNILGISVEDQSKFKHSYDAFNTWKERIEANGVLVFQESFHQLSGFTISARDPGLIFLNSTDHIKRRIFTLMHELGHLLLNDGSISDVKDYDGDGDKIEVFCNKFAAELLVPSESLHALVAKSFSGQEINFSRVTSLARSFSVSAKMMLVRLKTTRYVDADNFRVIEREINRRNDEVAKERDSDTPIKIPYHIRFGSKISRRYAWEIFRSYDAGRLSMHGVLGRLRLGSAHVAKLRSYLEV